MALAYGTSMAPSGTSNRAKCSPSTQGALGLLGALRAGAILWILS